MRILEICVWGGGGVVTDHSVHSMHGRSMQMTTKQVPGRPHAFSGVEIAKEVRNQLTGLGSKDVFTFANGYLRKLK